MIRVLCYGKKPVGYTWMTELKKSWFRQMGHRISREGWEDPTLPWAKAGFLPIADSVSTCLGPSVFRKQTSGFNAEMFLPPSVKVFSEECCIASFWENKFKHHKSISLSEKLRFQSRYCFMSPHNWNPFCSWFHFFFFFPHFPQTQQVLTSGRRRNPASRGGLALPGKCSERLTPWSLRWETGLAKPFVCLTRHGFPLGFGLPRSRCAVCHTQSEVRSEFSRALPSRSTTHLAK